MDQPAVPGDPGPQGTDGRVAGPGSTAGKGFCNPDMIEEAAELASSRKNDKNDGDKEDGSN